MTRPLRRLGATNAFADLIARLEAATEGSRELDEAIAKATGALPKEARFVYFNPEDGMAQYNWMQTDANDPEPYLSGAQGEPYTTSIDAALMLVPKGWSWRVGDTPSGGFADLGTQVSLQCIRGATPALALVIAALRASAAGRR